MCYPGYAFLYSIPTTSARSFPASSSFSSCGGSTSEHFPKTLQDNDTGDSRSKSTGKGSLAYQEMVDHNDREEPSQTSAHSLSLELQATGGRTDAKTGYGGGHNGDVSVINGNEEPGLWGPDGLLAVPHVKTVLILVCIVEVREQRTATTVDNREIAHTTGGKHLLIAWPLT